MCKIKRNGKKSYKGFGLCLILIEAISCFTIVMNLILNKYKSMFEIVLSITAVFALIVIGMIILRDYLYKTKVMNTFYNKLLSLDFSDIEIDETAINNVEKNALYEAREVFERIKSVYTLIENISKNEPFDNIMNFIYNSFSEFIPYTYIGVALIQDDGKNIMAYYGAKSEYHKNLRKRFLGYKTSLRSTSLAKLLETGDVRIINDLEEYVKGKPLKEYNRILLEEGIRSSITFPLINNGKPVGIIFFSSNRKNAYKKEHVSFLKTISSSIMFSIEKDILVDDMIISSASALATLTEERDSETGRHIERMQRYSKALAQILSKDEKYKDIVDIKFINDIERFSPLHDIGKMAIPDNILKKPGKLTKEEFDIMKTHTVFGGKVLRISDENLKKKGRSVFKMAIDIAEGHHEKWDGSGYPYGKKREEIPLCARIVAVADVLDALLSRRVYKKPYSFEQSIRILSEGKGKHFDPYIINAMLNNIDKFRNIYDEFVRIEQLDEEGIPEAK